MERGPFFFSVFLFLSLWLSCSLAFTFLPGLLIILCFFYAFALLPSGDLFNNLFSAALRDARLRERKANGGPGRGWVVLGWVGSRSGGVGWNGGKGMCCDEGK
jgi:hypothetical protein